MADVGRPTVVTPEVLLKLHEAFLIGATDKEACFVANISMATLYKYCQENPEFADRKEELKDSPKYQARKNIDDAIREGDKDISQWYLERKLKNEFSTRTETDITTKGEKINTSDPKVLEVAKKYEEEIKGTL